MSDLIKPHGGILKELIVDCEKAKTLKKGVANLKSWNLTDRQILDLEMLLNGAFSPLEGFLSKEDYDLVLNDMRLKNGVLWPIPITLDVTKDFSNEISINDDIVLRDSEGTILAILSVSDIWSPNKLNEAKCVFSTVDATHPGVDFLINKTNEIYIGGKITGIEMPRYYDFTHLRNTPKELREKFKKFGWNKVVAFQTRNPMHRAHKEITVRAAKENEANLLIHPVVGITKPGDVNHYSRVHCYEYIKKHYPEHMVYLSLLPLAMRMAGPREALWHTIIRKNYGCTNFIVGRDHAGPGNDSNGNPFYGPYDAQKLVLEFKSELEISMVPFKEVVYVKEMAQYLESNEVPDGMTVEKISGTEFRRRLKEGLEFPEWFTYKEVVEELRNAYPPKHKQGFTVFFTGLSGAGKSTVAKALMAKLMEINHRPITLLDGDIVRKNLSSELGFSKEHRDLNILRIGFVASEITKNGGIAICAPIAPYSETRKSVKKMIEETGGFLEIHVSTPIEVCEQRDVKGLYAKAREGLIKGFTGIDDPYEIPKNPTLQINTEHILPEEAVSNIVLKLKNLGYLE